MTEPSAGGPSAGGPAAGGRSTARRAAVIGARAAGGTVGLGIAVLAIAIAVFAPLPHYAVTAPSVLVTPVATPQQLVCPGAVLRLGDEQGGGASIASPVGTPTVTTGSTSGAATATPFGTDQGSPTGLTQSDAPTATVSGSESQVVNSPDMSGFAAAGCSSVSTDSWLVGGSTTTGRTTLVTLANPGDVASVVDLDVYGNNGAVSAPGAAGIEVAPGGQTVLSLAAFAPDTESPVVHVTSTGGHIVATLQQSVVRGLEPGGVDFVGATGNPALTVIVPGLVVLTPDDVENRVAQDAANADLKTVVRLFAPGAGAATATIDVVPEAADADTGGLSFEAPLVGGTVSDVPIEGLDPGTYTVTVTSTLPVVGAVRVSTVSNPDGGANTSDFAWLASPTPVSQGTAFTVAEGPDAVLHVVNPSARAIGAKAAPVGGTPLAFSVPAQASISVPVVGGTTYAFEADKPVQASVGYAGSAQLANVTVDPRLADAEPIVVYP